MLTDYDRRVYTEQLADFLPDKIIDMHAHIWQPGVKRFKKRGGVSWTQLVAPHQTYDDLVETYAALFPDKKVSMAVMGSPSCDLDTVNGYALDCIKKYGAHAYFCTNYDTTPEQIKAALDAGFIGIKPYQNNSPKYIPSNELRIFDFLTYEQLEYMNLIGGTVILHIPRALRLRDPINLHQMMQIDRCYPNAKVVIAHVGRAYVKDDIGDAFALLAKSKNLLFDFSANVYDYAMEQCISTVGTDRVMFGTDMPYVKMRMYRIDDGGSYVNVVPKGLYGDISGDIHMRETDESDITLFVYEELLALRRAAEHLSLTRTDIEKLFYTNASTLLGIKL